MEVDTLAVITRVIEKAQFDLTMQGYTEEQVSAAIKKSRNYATSVSKGISAPIREMAFVDLFLSDIQHAEKWLSGIKSSPTAWKEGLESIGATVGPQTQAAYERWAS